jgi:hypothetical protein
MEINLNYKMSRKFRIVYYSVMTILLLTFAYHAYLFVSIVFGLPDKGLSILSLAWD